MQWRLLWERMRTNIIAEVKTAEQKLTDHCRLVNANPNATICYDLTEAAASCKKLRTVAQSLDDRLINKLNEALNATGEERAGRQEEVGSIIEEYLAFVKSSPLLAAMQTSQVAPSNLRQSLLGVLTDLKSKL